MLSTAAAVLAILNSPVAHERVPASASELVIVTILAIGGMILIILVRGWARAVVAGVIMGAGLAAGVIYSALYAAADAADFFHGYTFLLFWYFGMGSSAMLGLLIPRRGMGLSGKLIETVTNAMLCAAAFTTGLGLMTGILT